MKSLAIFIAGAILLAIFFQCCPPPVSEAPAVRPAGEEPTGPPPPTPAPMGLSADNPVPLNHTLTASNGAAITIHGITARGEEATQLAQTWNPFNVPGEGDEYVIASATVAYEDGYAETLRISQYEFRVTIENRIFEHPFAFVMTEADELEGEMLEGGSIHGLLVFEVPQGSTGIVLMYSVPFGRTYFFATE